MTIRAAIFGGSGYGGSELLRILLFHPDVEIAFVTANEHAGKRVGEVHRNLLGLTDASFVPAPSDLDSTDVDIAFFALPHGQAMDLIPKLPAGVKAIDLSEIFGSMIRSRLRNTTSFLIARPTFKNSSSTGSPKQIAMRSAKLRTSRIPDASRRRLFLRSRLW
jgi:hypothetical protein